MIFIDQLFIFFSAYPSKYPIRFDYWIFIAFFNNKSLKYVWKLEKSSFTVAEEDEDSMVQIFIILSHVCHIDFTLENPFCAAACSRLLRFVIVEKNENDYLVFPFIELSEMSDECLIDQATAKSSGKERERRRVTSPRSFFEYFHTRIQIESRILLSRGFCLSLSIRIIHT